MPKRTVKHEHTLVRLTTQQRVLLAVRAGMTGMVKIRGLVQGL
jgi:hypothetical protein